MSTTTDTESTPADSAHKLARARTRLILEKPFLGALVLRLPLQGADPSWCQTTGTDARKFYYNDDYVRALKPLELQFTLAHEALHCALSHFNRRQHRHKARWDLACDYAINPILLDEGLTPPPGVMVMNEYRGMSAEEIYPCLQDNDLSETMDQHLYDKSDSSEGGQSSCDNPLDNQPSPETDEPSQPQQKQPSHQDGGGEPTSQPVHPEQDGPINTPPPSLSQAERDNLEEQWQHRTAGAAQQAQQTGKLSGVLARFFDQQAQAQLPWRAVLSQYLSATARDDYSWSRPSSRRGDPALYPSLRSQQANVVLAIDVSGSISKQALNDCLSEVDALKGQLRARVDLLACDANIVDGFPKTFESWEPLRVPEALSGGGSTRFEPVFDWVATQDHQPDVLVYFTDGRGSFPTPAPSYPVIWMIKGHAEVPWGRRIQFN